MAKAAVFAAATLATTAAAGGYTAYESRQARKDQEAFNKRQEKKAADELAAAEKAEADALAEAEAKTAERKRRLAEGGRESTFRTGATGLASRAPIQRKTLLGA